ncbi:MAG TPA: hypothetical protein VFS00_27490 [Polyangiaceae bacterium]|nr:hypothetical protein [Polyangiaceae bacterium]
MLGGPPNWLEPDVLEPLRAQAVSAGKAQHPYRRATKIDDVVFVVDLPGAEGALVGVALARHGFQPVPLYNALPAKGPMVVDQRPVMRVLAGAAPALDPPSDRAPPAFLLDANRLDVERLAPGAFDNRSVCFTTDFPSAQKLLDAGIRRAVILQTKDDYPQIDLGETLELWRKAGLELFIKCASVPGPPRRCERPRPPALLRLLYRLGHKRFVPRPDGSFGTRLPTAPPAGSVG